MQVDQRQKLTLVLHKISSSEAYRAVYKALHGIFTGLSLVILSEIQESECCALDAAIEAAQRFWAGILCNTRVELSISFSVPLRRSHFSSYVNLSGWASANSVQYLAGYLTPSAPASLLKSIKVRLRSLWYARLLTHA